MKRRDTSIDNVSDGKRPKEGSQYHALERRLNNSIGNKGSTSPGDLALELSSMALDAVQSGTKESSIEIQNYSIKKLSSLYLPSTGSMHQMTPTARCLAEAIFKFFLSGYASNKLLSILTQLISSAILYSFSSAATRPTLNDYKYILEHLALCGYRGDSLIIIDILRYVEMTRMDEKSTSPPDRQDMEEFLQQCNAQGYWLHMPSGDPLMRLWSYSAKKKKIRDEAVQLTPGTRRMQPTSSAWEEELTACFEHNERPLVIDLGCGYGVSLLDLALDDTQSNYLGCDLSALAINYANNLTKVWKIESRCRFLVAPVEPIMKWLREHYQGPIRLVLIQFPTPYKLPTAGTKTPSGNLQLPTVEAGFMVTQTLVQLIVEVIAASRGSVYIQSNVEDVAVSTRKNIEAAIEATVGSSWEYLVANSLADEIGSQVVDSGVVKTRRQEQWKAQGGELAEGKGWLTCGLFGTRGRTETEATYGLKGKSVYRIGWKLT